MRTKPRIAALLLSPCIAAVITALLAGCDNKPKTEAAPTIIFKEQQQTLDQAQAVQQATEQLAKESQQKIDEASGK